MKTAQNCTEPTDYPVGSIGHYKHYVNEYQQIKELAENARGNLADELNFELFKLELILEEYEPYY